MPPIPSQQMQKYLQQFGINANSVGSSGSTTGTRNQPNTVWLGQSTVKVPAGFSRRGPESGAPHTYGQPTKVHPGGTKVVQRTETVHQLMQEFYGSWPASKIAALKHKMVAAGVLQPDAGMEELAAKYEAALKLAASMYSAGRRVTPDDIIANWLGTGLGGGGPLMKPSVMNRTQKSTDLTDPDSANALLVQSLQNELGRDPTAAEKNAFLASLHEHERANPTVTRSKYKLDPVTGQYSLVSQKHEGGTNPQAFAQEYGEDFDPEEAGAYQASTTFFNALLGALGATTSAGAGAGG